MIKSMISNSITKIEEGGICICDREEEIKNVLHKDQFFHKLTIDFFGALLSKM